MGQSLMTAVVREQGSAKTRMYDDYPAALRVHLRFVATYREHQPAAWLCVIV